MPPSRFPLMPSGGPLAAVEDCFAQLAAGGVLMLPAGLISSRPLPVGDLRAVLLGPRRPSGAADLVWGHILERVQAGQPPWVIGALWLAAPGLRRAVRRVARTVDRDREDLEQEAVTAFLAETRAVELPGRGLFRVLLLAADRAVHQHAYQARVHAAQLRREPFERMDGPCSGPLEAVLARAVTAGVVSAVEAEVVAATRLDRESLALVARRLGLRGAAVAGGVRRAAEARLAVWLRAGGGEFSVVSGHFDAQTHSAEFSEAS